MKKLGVAMVFLSLVPSVQARTAKRPYNFPCETVWKAALEMASQKPYHLQIQNEKDRQFLVQTGNWATGERSVSVQLVPNGTGCEAIANGPFAGFEHRDTKDLLDRIAEKLEGREPMRKSRWEASKQTGQKPDSIAEAPTSAQSKALTNGDVVGMVKAGIGAEIIVAKIKNAPCSFDTGPTALKELKDAGVPDNVILAMVQASKN